MISKSSKDIEQQLSKIRDKKSKSAFLNSNTLAKELEHGFKQANTIVIKPENIDAGLFRETIDYLLRNKIPYGNILLINKYGKVRAFTHKDIKSGEYMRKTKGFL